MDNGRGERYKEEERQKIADDAKIDKKPSRFM
jgi:hypothetical protein